MIVDVYRAVFQAKPEDLERASRQFVARFGQGVFDRYIRPYLYMNTPGYLFSAVTSPYKYWLLDRIARNAAQAADEEYTPPPEFLAVDIPSDLEIVKCSNCGADVEMQFAMDGERFGKRVLCNPCFFILSFDLVMQFVSQFHAKQDGDHASTLQL